ncbi:hypothetical protein KFK09_022817 [Dendrobium nobile]|uniref:Beta-adaptin appendage C-terminal subdomain domain-containing protein n=1 Tax=Dendrobium nobile TaxID=94219 RepID=A0A8T3AK69_DENNO|nr:hypothetical protein KFK09_022817 [Dendrobium nobile]
MGYYSFEAFVVNRLEVALRLAWISSQGGKKPKEKRMKERATEVSGKAANVFWRMKCCLDWWVGLDPRTRRATISAFFGKTSKTLQHYVEIKVLDNNLEGVIAAENEEIKEELQRKSYGLARDKPQRVTKAPQRYGFAGVISYTLLADSMQCDEPTSYKEAMSLSMKEIQRMKELPKDEFDMMDLGPARKILGMEIERKLSKDQSPKEEEEKTYMSTVPYQNAVGSIMYIMVCCKPDLAHPLSVISRRSLTDYIFKIYGNTASWKCKLQPIVALSTAEAEYMAAAGARGWLAQRLVDRNLPRTLIKPIHYEVQKLFENNWLLSIGLCAIKLERAAERCISVLLELIKVKVNYVVQEAIIVIKDIFRRYPNTYESIIATLCESLDTLDEPEAKASMIWIIGEYAERIDNADELLESFLESFPEEQAMVQLQLLTATVKLFLKKPTEGPQQMIQVVLILNNATMETDNPDLRDRAYIYWRLLSTDPEAAKDVVLAEKPVISDDSNSLEPSLLDELLGNIATLSSVYHKLPEAFVSRAKLTFARPDGEEYPAAVETGNSESPSYEVDGAAATSSQSFTSPETARLPAPVAAAPTPSSAPASPPAPRHNFFKTIVTYFYRPPLPVLLPSTTGQGLQISAQLVRRDGKVFYNLLLEYNSQVVLDGFMIQFNKNTFGLAAAGPLQIPPLLPQDSARTLLPMVMLQNLSTGPPNTLLQVAVKNNQQPVWYFNDKISLHTWKSLPDSNEVAKDLSSAIIHSIDSTVENLAATNFFFAAKRRNANKDILYMSAKGPRGIPFLIELTASVGAPGIKCAVKTPSLEMAPLLFDAMEALLK